MSLKSLTPLIVIILGILPVYASEQAINYKLYGFVRNDFYYNSRVNVQGSDGLFSIFPKPFELNTLGEDINSAPNAELLSIATRLGLNFSGSSLLGAKSTAKIEFDFSGNSVNYYLIRIRQAYMKLNWNKTELLVGQTWHPMFGNVAPTILSLNAGCPFQPFNRSPQIRLKQNISDKSYLTVAASYQMQYLSNGPLGKSATYLKNAIAPDLFVGFESKTKHWTSGIGVETKTLKINHQKLRSASAELHTQYIAKKFKIKAKGLLGQNMSDYLMIGGYGVMGTDTNYNEDTYTNLNTLSSWLNIVYGSKLQASIFAGISENLGTVSPLAPSNLGEFTTYGYGFYNTKQELLQTLYRISGGLIYNISNFKLGIEYEFTNAIYGNINNKGLTDNPYNANNNRITASINFYF